MAFIEKDVSDWKEIELESMKEDSKSKIDPVTRHQEHMKVQREYNLMMSAQIDSIAGKESYNPDGTVKAMKATLILEREVNGDHWTAGDPTIEVDGYAALHAAIRDWRMENGIPPKFIRYVHYDGMLFECTTKSILAEVGTGIEI